MENHHEKKGVLAHTGARKPIARRPPARAATAGQTDSAWLLGKEERDEEAGALEQTQRALEDTATLDMEEQATFQEQAAESAAATEEAAPAFTDTSDGAESQPQPEAQPQGTNEEPAAENGLTVKYNGEERILSREEAVQYAQKGMNYDHVYEEMKALREDPAIAIINELAEQSGMSREAYIAQIRENQRAQEMKRLVQQGIPEQYAKELMEARKSTMELKRQIEELRDVQQEQQRAQKQRDMWAEFFRAHPDVEGYDALPETVKQQIAAGAEPGAAYMAYENAQLKAQLKALRQSNQNRETAPGGIHNE